VVDSRNYWNTPRRTAQLVVSIAYRLRYAFLSLVDMPRRLHVAVMAAVDLVRRAVTTRLLKNDLLILLAAYERGKAALLAWVSKYFSDLVLITFLG